ncbi:MAG: SGNH/GDSL hydrolase family protein [Candidatus Binataceae bacterium]
MSTLKRAAANLALAIAGITAALVLGEFALRLTPLGYTSFFVFDSVRGWAPKPGAHGIQNDEGHAYVSINRWGLRGPDFQLAKPPGVFRIAVLGDSFTAAEQVPMKQTFCSIMQGALGKCPSFPGRAEVLDFGVGGYGTAQELLTLHNQAWRFHPDFVVLAIFTGNDIQNNSVELEPNKCRPFYVYRNGQLVPGGAFDDSPRFHAKCAAQFKLGRLQLYQVLRRALSVIRSKRPANEPHRTRFRLGAQIYQPPETEALRNAWRVTEGEIEAIHREAAAHHAGFLAVTLSNGIQVNPNLNRRRRFAYQLGVRDLFYPDHRIAELGKRDGFSVLNLAPQMAQYADEHHVFLHGLPNSKWLPGVGHYNATGHQVAGELIGAKICAMLSKAGIAPPLQK